MMGSNIRGRLTPVDVVFYAVALFVIGIFVGPIVSLMEVNAGAMSTATAYVWQLIVPMLIVVILFVVYLTGASGGGA